MTQQEYFGDWYRYIDEKALSSALNYLKTEKEFYPQASLVFKAFTMCNPRDVKIVMLGMDPYPQKGVATGIAFGNSSDTPESKISPSLDILKEAAINYEIPHNILTFDNTLEYWAKQGVLLLNSALTVKPGSPGSHALVWRLFTSSFLKKFSEFNGAVYVLFGSRAQSFEPYINPLTSTIIKEEHPAYLARKHRKLEPELFTRLKELVFRQTGEIIKWYEEEDYGQFSL